MELAAVDHRHRDRTMMLSHTGDTVMMLALARAVLQAVAVALAASSDRHQPLNADRFIDALSACEVDAAFSSRLSRIRTLIGNDRPDRTRRALGSGPSALQSVPAAIAAFLHAPDDPGTVWDFAVRFGGDTDTVAAMAGALAGGSGGGALRRRWPAGRRSRSPGERSDDPGGGGHADPVCGPHRQIRAASPR